MNGVDKLRAGPCRLAVNSPAPGLGCQLLDLPISLDEIRRQEIMRYKKISATEADLFARFSAACLLRIFKVAASNIKVVLEKGDDIGIVFIFSELFNPESKLLGNTRPRIGGGIPTVGNKDQ